MKGITIIMLFFMIDSLIGLPTLNTHCFYAHFEFTVGLLYTALILTCTENKTCDGLTISIGGIITIVDECLCKLSTELRISCFYVVASHGRNGILQENGNTLCSRKAFKATIHSGVC